MDCKREFLSKVNINILWDIIYENTIYNNISISLDKLKLLFSNIINDFGNNEQMHNLIETNKKFITIINNKIKEEIETSKPKPKQLITFDDIQKDRTNLFEKQLIEKQNDFNHLINKEVPNAPNFKNDIDKPIEEMELLIKKTIEQRNLDLIKINAKADVLKTEQFLKSSNTSIKSENNELKQIKIDYLNNEVKPKLKNFNIIDLNTGDNEKKVTWMDEAKDTTQSARAAAATTAAEHFKLEQNFLSKLKIFETKASNEFVSQNIDVTTLNDKLDILLSRNIDVTTLNDKLDIILSRIDLILSTHNLTK